MKSAVVAKLANQCSFLYADALKLIQADAVKSLWPKVLPCRYNNSIFQRICGLRGDLARYK